jgi:uncharacterized protein YggE
MPIQPGILRVSATAERELEASSSRVHFTLEGETFVYGNAALSRSREVADLVSKFKALGLLESEIQVVSVTAKIQSGTLLKSTRAVFRLCLNVRDLSKLTDVLGLIVSAKNANLDLLEWMFEEEAVLLELVVQAMKKVAHKAEVMVQAIGKKIAGLHSASDSSELPHFAPVTFAQESGMDMMRMRAPKGGSMDLGTELRGSKMLSSQVVAEFWVTDQEDLPQI